MRSELRLRNASAPITLLAGIVLMASCNDDSSLWSPAPPSGVDAVQSVTGGPFAFTNFELGAAPGTVCPGSSGCTNGAAEPAIRADATGTFYVSSELGLSTGTLAWKSTDGGLHYTALTSPNQISQAAGGLATGGGDTDLGVAPQANASGIHNVYVASLSLANVTVSSSQDGGKTWNKNVLSATIPGDDREWIAADQATKVCISYHDVVTFNIDVNCSFDAGASFTQLGSAIDAAHAFLLEENSTGNLVIDPKSHVMYQVFSGIANAAEAVIPTNFHAVWIAVSRDGGVTFTDNAVYVNADPSASYGHQFINATVDQAGTIYVVYNDNHNLFYSFSTNSGLTWTGPIQINQPPSATAIMPWSIACAPGQLNVVWYGTSFFDGTTTPDNYPASAAWYVFFAQNRNAAVAGSKFTQVAATPIVHFGGACESGVTCTGNRDLFDDFGIAVSPTTGEASIAYSDDQPGNTGSDDHTAIATQTAGPKICAGT
ncbi:MAG TPA: sialidase family protein [Gemmatimonadales bacterium]|nr:sialidase family protein [Gemmatimonadales bacterium]